MPNNAGETITDNFTSGGLKQPGGYGAQISETGVSVNHSLNIFGEFKMCHILTSNSTYYLFISEYNFLEEFCTTYAI